MLLFATINARQLLQKNPLAVFAIALRLINIFGDWSVIFFE